MILADNVNNGIAYVSLFIALNLLYKKVKLRNIKIVYLGIVLYCIIFYISGRYLSVLTIMGVFLTASILSGTIKYINKPSYNKIFLNIALTFYIFNIVISWIEYQSQINLFYFDMSAKYDVVNSYYRFRASGIWGHPLYTAMIHGACMLFILMSSLNKNMKILLWTLGLFTIFLYDARASTLSIIGASLIYVYFKGLISRKHLKWIIFMGIILYFSFEYIAQSELGGKLFDTQTRNFNDESSNARIIAIQIFMELDAYKLLFGVPDQFAYAQKYHVICAENAFVGSVLVYGLPLAVIIFYLFIDNFRHLMCGLDNKYKILIFAYIFSTGLFNQALTGTAVWIGLYFFYILFCFNNKETFRINENRYHNISCLG